MVAAAWDLQADPLPRLRNGCGFGNTIVPSSGSGWRYLGYCSRCGMSCQLTGYTLFGFRSGGGLGIASVSSGGGLRCQC